VTSQVHSLISIFEKYGRKWILDRVTGLDIRVGKLKAFTAACFVKTPNYLAKKKATINVKKN